MKTIVLVDVKLEASCGGLDSIIALQRDPAIRAVSIALDNDISAATEAEIDWGARPPFNDSNDSRYLPELLKKAEAVDASAMRDLDARLRTLGAPAGSTLRIHTLDCEKCTPCGNHCHEIDGRVAVDDGSSRTGALVYRAVSDGKPVSFTVRIECKYITR